MFAQPRFFLFHEIKFHVIFSKVSRFSQKLCALKYFNVEFIRFHKLYLMGDKSWIGDVSITLYFEESVRKTSSHISMFTLDNAITLLTSKKRGEYPTTIQTSRKKAEISADLHLLESKGGPFFNER